MGRVSAIELIQRIVHGHVALNVPLNDYTTVLTGGPADIMISPADRQDLARICQFLTKRDIGYFVLGAGSGIIVRDGGIRGAVVNLGPSFSNFEVVSKEGEEPLIKAEAGLSLESFVTSAAKANIAGFEFLYGIPGTIGGAIFNNAFSWGQKISERLASLEVMFSDGETIDIDGETLIFGDSKCELPSGSIILSGTFRGKPGEEEEILARVKANMDRRMVEQPMTKATAGMIFLNPEDKEKSAEDMIDECGLKGIKVGEAEISTHHSNFIENHGNASASQIVSLIGLMQERVFVKHKVNLKMKVELVGSRQREKLRIKR